MVANNKGTGAARSTSRRTAPASPVTPVPDGILRIGDEPEEPRYEHLFAIAGKPYEVLVNPSASLLIEYLEKVRKNSHLAVSWLLEEMVGADGYQALKESGTVTAADFRKVVDLVVGLVLGTPGAGPKSPPATSGR